MYGNKLTFDEVMVKVKQFSPVDIQDISTIIANHEESLLKFMADNDYIQVYKALHESDSPLVIGENASFTPDRARVEGELEMLLAKKDYKTLNEIISKFIVNPNTVNWTTDRALLACLNDDGVLKATDDGYKFNVKLS